MKEYNFEYFNQKFTAKLVVALFALFLILFFTSVVIYSKISVKSSFAVLFCLLFSFIIPFIIYRLNRKKITKHGSAIIHDSSAEFNLDGDQRKINYADIESYLIQNYNGTLLNLVMKDGEKFNISASTTYCDTVQFYLFCVDFEKALGKFDEVNNLLIVRKKTFFERGWLLPFLVIMTGVLIFIIIRASAIERKLPTPTLLFTLGPLLSLWGAYFAARNRKNKT